MRGASRSLGGKCRRSAIAVAAIAIAMLAIGCGDDDQDAGSAGAATTATSASGEGSALFVAGTDKGSLRPAGGTDSGAYAYTLTLQDPDSRVIVFTDRPERKVDSESLADFVDAWEGRGFKEDPPNAALEVAQGSGEPLSGVFEISNPRYDNRANTLSFDATSLGNGGPESLAEFGPKRGQELPSSFGDASLFIDSAPGDPPGTQYWQFAGGNGAATVTFDKPLNYVTFQEESGDVEAAKPGQNQFQLTCFSDNCSAAFIFALDSLPDPITGSVDYNGKPGYSTLSYKDAGGQQHELPEGSFSVPAQK